MLTVPPRGVIISIGDIMSNEVVRTRHRSDEEKKYLQDRLKTVEGQVRGIINMLDEDRYCGDILIQLSAIDKSLRSIGNKILKSHLSTCVVDDIKNDKLEVIDEIMELIKRLD